MANRVFTIKGLIDIDNKNAKKQITETTETGQRSTEALTASLGKIAAGAVAIGTVAASAMAAAYGSLKSIANGTSEYADTVDKTSQRMKVSTDYFQQLSYAADQCGVGMTALEQAAKRLEGKGLNLEQAINEIVSLTSEEEKSQRAVELFGKTFAYQLTPLLNQSSESYNGLINRANELGVVLSGEAISAGVKYNDTINDMQAMVSGLTNKLGASLMPVMMKLAQAITAKMPQIQEMFDKISPVLVQLLDTIVPLLIDLVSTILPPMFDLIMAILPLISSLIENVMPVLNELLQLIVPLLVDVVEIILPLLTPLLDLISGLLMPILQLLEPILALLQPFIDLIVVIANILGGVLKVALNTITQAIGNFFDKWKNVFGAILNIAKKPINGVIDTLNGLIKGLNKIKLPDWVPGLGGKGINIPLIKKLRVGLEYVPYDEMPALLHKGEAILNKDEAKEYRENKYKTNDIQTNNYYNTINVEHLEVRDDMDIKRISEELYYLQKKAEV